MYTSVGILVLTFLTPSPRPEWHNDYWSAMKTGERQQKPLAVFIGKGDAGFRNLTGEGPFSDGVRKILAERYICVYLNLDNARCRELAREFEINRGNGLVISDRTGRIQAYHHDGVLGQEELSRKLEHFSNPQLVVQQTESNTVRRVSYYQNEPAYRPRTVSC
jgi:hypothetical protein